MPSNVTLAYSATAVGPISPTQLATAMAAVTLPYSDLANVGVTFSSSTVTTVGSVVTRTLVFSLLPPFTTYAPQSAPGTFQGSIVSSSPNDIQGGTGAYQVTINYTDENGAIQVENAQLKGTTFVNLVSQTKVTINSVTVTGTPSGMITVMSGLNGEGVLVNRILNNFQGSIVSTSPNDTAAGIGAQTVTITYLDKTGAGPFTETVTLNGTTPVSLANTNHATITNMTATFGSYGSSTGIISIYTGVPVTPAGGTPQVSGAFDSFLGPSFYQYFPPQTTILSGLKIGGNLAYPNVPAQATVGTSVNSDEGQLFRGIYTQILGAALACPVTAAEPVFS